MPVRLLFVSTIGNLVRVIDGIGCPVATFELCDHGFVSVDLLTGSFDISTRRLIPNITLHCHLVTDFFLFEGEVDCQTTGYRGAIRGFVVIRTIVR